MTQNKNKDGEEQILQQMIRLAYSKQSTIQQWKQLTQRSRYTKIKAYQQITHKFKFAHFVEQILQNDTLERLSSHVECFCLQAIANNSELAFDRLHYGKMIWDLLIRYLLGAQTGNTLKQYIHRQQLAYNMLKYILQNRLIIQQTLVFRLTRHLIRYEIKATHQHRQTLHLILQYVLKLCQKGQLEGLSQDSPLSVQIQTNLITYLLRYLMLNYTNSSYIYHMQFHKKYQDQDDQQQVNVKQLMEYMLQIINNHPIVLHNFKESIIMQILAFKNSCRIFQKFMQYQNIKQLIMSNHVLCAHFFIYNWTSCASIVWQSESCRNAISKMKIKGLNILQHTCRSYSITYRLIIMLWDSGLFNQMPYVNNARSRQIIKQKYDIQF